MEKHRLALFFEFLRAIVRHTTTIVLAIVGSSVLAVLGWVRSLLSDHYQKVFDRYTVLQPIAYRWLALGVLLVGFLFACFFAWEEERDDAENERKAKDKLRQTLADPILEGDVLPFTRWGPANNGLATKVTFRISVRNTGLVPSIVKDWHLFVPPTLHLGPSLPRSPYRSPNEPLASDRLQPLALVPPDPTRPQHRDAIQPGDADELEKEFLIPLSPAELKGLNCEIRFRDVRNKMNVISWNGFH